MNLRGRQIIAGMLLAIMGTATLAADIQPGLWELVVESRIAAAPGFSPEPVTMQQCLTELDAQDPSRILGGVSNPGATNCTYTEKSSSGNVFRFRMECAGSLGIQARGEIAYSASAMDGRIVTVAGTAGQPTELQSRITARRLGGC
ncbi:DUF3617 domain-containing protein [Candidatus Ferrigenium straubiae]|jgi:hypothetical protein|uniref:DUF3617 domain-containing protein n=1 Tax=Candidatus Ferrigenium straubiae TaxID=2919506 RepID=UPI003F4A8F5E